MKGLQLPLGVQLSDTASFETYHAGPNAEAVAALRATLAGAGAPLLFLYGPPASGKTHLLQALMRAAAAGQTCAYLPLVQLHGRGEDAPEILDGLEALDLVGLDDLGEVLGAAGWPLALLRLLDALRAHGGRCVITASAPAERLALPLADLRTRLTAAATYGLRPLGDADREHLLRARARARGLELPPDAARYLLARLPRDTGSLLAALDRLDRDLLSARRRLTLAFVQQWLRQSFSDSKRA